MNKAIQDLYKVIETGNIVKDIECRGKTFTMRSLCDADLVWRDQFINTANPASLTASLRAPTIAVATIAIDGTPVEEEESLKQMDATIPAEAREYVAANAKYLVAYNLYDKVISKLPRDFVVELHAKYIKEVESVANVTPEQLKNS